MTIEEKLKEMLVGNGLFPSQAEEVMTRVKNDQIDDEMKKRWSDDISGYPTEFISALWLGTRRVTLTYIIESCPMAWFRPMFEDQENNNVTS